MVQEEVFDIFFNTTTQSDDMMRKPNKNGMLAGTVTVSNRHQRSLRSEYNIRSITQVSNGTILIAPTPKMVGNVPSVPTPNFPVPSTPHGYSEVVQMSVVEGQSSSFLLFLLWYSVLVLCCIIPTCCAYRRRRLLEQSITSQHNDRMNRIVTLQQQHQDNPNQVPDDAWNLLPYLYYQHQIRAQLQQQAEGTTFGIADGQQQSNSFFASLTNPSGGGVDEETLRSERAVIFRKELQNSSMIIKDENLERIDFDRSKTTILHDSTEVDENDDNKFDEKLKLEDAVVRSSSQSEQIETPKDRVLCTSTGISSGALEHHTTMDDYFFENDSNTTTMLRLPRALDKSQMIPLNDNINEESINIESHDTNSEFSSSDGVESAKDDVNKTDSIEDTFFDVVNGNRTVPALCAICLGMYEPGDCVTWSTSVSCQHAFHTECILEWLTKKAPSIVANTSTTMDSDSTKCPLCRTEFCPVATTKIIESIRTQQQQQHTSLRERFLGSHNDLTSANVLDSFTQALALSHLYHPGTSDGNGGLDNRNNNNLTFLSVDGAGLANTTTNDNHTGNNTTTTGPSSFFQLGARRAVPRRYPVTSIVQTAEQQQAAAHASILQQLQQLGTTVPQPLNAQSQQQSDTTTNSRRRLFRRPFPTQTTDSSSNNVNTNIDAVEANVINNPAIVLPLTQPSNPTDAADSVVTPIALPVPDVVPTLETPFMRPASTLDN